MRTLAKATVVALTLLGSGSAFAQVSAQVTIATPTIQFEAAPPLVYVSPGVQVVQDYDEEVFFTGGWYWCRRGDVWFRTHDYRGGWIVAPRRYVPARIYGMPPGHYKHWRGGDYRGPGYRGGGYRGGGYGHPGRYHEVRGGEYRRHEARAYGPAPRGAMVVREHGGGERGGGHGHGKWK